jgi:rubrerythrin
MTLFPRVTSIAFVPSSFVDGKMPGQRKEMREVTINVCDECGAELDYDAPTYTCPECGETYSFKTDGVFEP